MINESEISKSYLHKVIQLLQYSFHSLNRDIHATKIEELAVIIYNVMQARWRQYHTIEHIFKVCETTSPIQILSGLLHDLVYLQIDRRIHPKLIKYLQEFKLDEEENFSILVPENIADDPVLDLVSYIFSLAGGTKINPTKAANEYLSAVVAARILENVLNQWEIIQIVSCIEMTVPFRKPNGRLTIPQILKEKLNAVNLKLNLKRNEKQIDDALKEAVELANRDVESFSNENFSEFTSDTWQLLLEGNPVFKNPLFTVKQYRSALFKMESFYQHFLKADLIYHKLDHPKFDNDSVLEMLKRAEKNIEQGKEYFQAKLLTASVIEAIAELTGGDTPIVLFIGQVAIKKVATPIMIETYLDRKVQKHLKAKANPTIVAALDKMIYDAITLGHAKEMTMSSYIYERLEANQRQEIYSKAVAFFKGELNPLDYLKEYSRELRESMINAAAQMASTRSQQILAIKKKINEM